MAALHFVLVALALVAADRITMGAVPSKTPRQNNLTHSGWRAPDEIHATYSDEAPKDASHEPFRFDDLPEPLAPRRQPTEAQQDRSHALALFATGRALEQRDQRAKALPYYQRAMRYDPRSKAAARAAVILAESLGWLDQRDRYLPQAVTLEPDLVDPINLVAMADRTEDEPLRRRVFALLEQMAADRADNPQKQPADVAMHWALAEEDLAAGAHDRAADRVALVIEAAEHPERFGLKPSEAKAWFGASQYRVFGETMLRAGRFDRAEPLFQRANELVPNPAALDYDLGRAALKRGKPDEALKRAEACLARRPTGLGLGPYTLLEDALEALGRKDELAGRVARLVKAAPTSAPAALFLAQTHRARGETDKARSILENLVAREPVAEAYRVLFSLYREKNETEKLAKLAGDVLEKAGSLDLLEEQITALSEDAAGSFFQKAVALAPDALVEWCLLEGRRLLGAEKFVEAQAVLQRGHEAKRATDDDRAIFSYYLAMALEMAGKTDEALAAARAAGQNPKRRPLAIAQEAWILFHAKRDAEAIRAYHDLIQQYDNDHAQPAVREILREARLVLAGLLVARGKTDQAQERLEQVLDEFPDDVSALNDLGYLWADNRAHLNRALAMTRRAVEAEPDVAAYRDSLGWALFRLGRLDEAAAELEKAAAADPDEGELLEHLGEVYRALDRAADAERIWRQAQTAYRKAGRADRAQKLDKKFPVTKP